MIDSSVKSLPIKQRCLFSAITPYLLDHFDRASVLASTRCILRGDNESNNERTFVVQEICWQAKQAPCSLLIFVIFSANTCQKVSLFVANYLHNLHRLFLTLRIPRYRLQLRRHRCKKDYKMKT